uniref:Uncharacterized protein n=1 Tax=Arundo donax TaxID=35708 RepID=A0A0A9BBI4_ARUDO
MSFSHTSMKFGTTSKAGLHYTD